MKPCKTLFLILLIFATVSFAETSGQIFNGSNAYYIATPYDGNEIWNIQYAQADNTMYLVDGNNVPQILTRADHNDWTIADVNFERGPFLPENVTTTTITPSDVNGSITLTAATGDANIFQDTAGASHIGSIWEIGQVRTTSTVSGSFTANDTSLASPSFTGDFGFTTSGSWNGTVTLQRSTNNGISWKAALTPLTDTNFDNPAQTEEDEAVYRVVMSNFSSGNCTYTFTITDNLNKGVVRITAVASATSATADVLIQLVDNSATTTWREGYWSDYRGWPKTVAFHQQRLVYGGSENYPQTIWFSKTDPDDYANFLEGTLDTSAFTVALVGQNPIRWLKSQDYLMIGTAGSTGKYGDQGKSITPTSPNYQEQNRIGCDPIMAINASESILFIERGGRKVREFAFSLRFDKYLSPDLNLLAEDITKSGIKDVAYQTSPDPILWCVLNDGNMATLTYQRDQDVVGWSKQITEGNFESVARIPGLTYEDEIWVVVLRTIDGNDWRYIEKFEPRNWGDDVNNAWFVDSGLDYSGSDANDFNGLGHLIAENVYIYADRLIGPNEVVDQNGSDGEIHIDRPAGRLIVGLPFMSRLETLPLRIHPQDKAANKRVRRLHFDLFETGALSYGPGALSEVTSINFENDLDADPNATAQDLVTSVVKFKSVLFPYGSMKKMTIYVETDKPMPLTIRSITTDYEARD